MLLCHHDLNILNIGHCRLIEPLAVCLLAFMKASLQQMHPIVLGKMCFFNVAVLTIVLKAQFHVVHRPSQGKISFQACELKQHFPLLLSEFSSILSSLGLNGICVSS